MRTLKLPIMIVWLALPAAGLGQEPPESKSIPPFLELVDATVRFVEDRAGNRLDDRELFLDLSSFEIAAESLNTGPSGEDLLRNTLEMDFRSDLEAARKVCDGGHCRLLGGPFVIGIHSVSGSLDSQALVDVRWSYNTWAGSPRRATDDHVRLELFFERREGEWALRGTGRMIIT